MSTLAKFDGQGRREEVSDVRKSVASTSAEDVARLEEEAYWLRLQERRIEGLQIELHLQQRSLAYAQAIACRVLKWKYPDLGEKLVPAIAQQIPL